MLSVYIFLYFIFRSPWVLVACLKIVMFYEPKFACRHTQIYAHAGIHMHRNNTVGTDAIIVMCRTLQPTEVQEKTK